MGKDNIMMVKQDKAMAQAALAARDTIKYFWQEVFWEGRRIIPGLNHAVAKVGFETSTDGKRAKPGIAARVLGKLLKADTSTPSHEHIWVSNVCYTGTHFNGHAFE